MTDQYDASLPDLLDLVAAGQRVPGDDPALQVLCDLRQALDAVVEHAPPPPRRRRPAATLWPRRAVAVAGVAAVALSLTGVAAAVVGPRALWAPVERVASLGHSGTAADRALRLLDEADSVVGSGERTGRLDPRQRARVVALVAEARRLAGLDAVVRTRADDITRRLARLTAPTEERQRLPLPHDPTSSLVEGRTAEQTGGSPAAPADGSPARGGAGQPPSGPRPAAGPRPTSPATRPAEGSAGPERAAPEGGAGDPAPAVGIAPGEAPTGEPSTTPEGPSSGEPAAAAEPAPPVTAPQDLAPSWPQPEDGVGAQQAGS